MMTLILLFDKTVMVNYSQLQVTADASISTKRSTPPIQPLGKLCEQICQRKSRLVNHVNI